MSDAGVLSNLEPCGYILATSEYKYFGLRCIHCDEKYGRWKSFIAHLKRDHVIIKQPENSAESARNRTYESISIEFAGNVENNEAPLCENYSKVILEVESLNPAVEYEATSPELTAFSADLHSNYDCGSDLDLQYMKPSKNHYENNSTYKTKDISSDDDIEGFNVSSDFTENIVNDSEDSFTKSELENNTKRKKIVISFATQNETTTDFIECYSQHPCLWHTEHSDYENSEKRIHALAEIRDFFMQKYDTNFTEKRLRNAIKRLHMFYKRICNKASIAATKRSKYYLKCCAFLSAIESSSTVPLHNSLPKKISFGHTDSFTLGFIDLCKNHPVLWDSTHPDYSLFSARSNAYAEIAKDIQTSFAKDFSKNEIYDSLYRLKQYYYGIVSKEHTNKPLTKSDLIYLERCKFLPPSKFKMQCHICERVLRSELTLQTHLLKEHSLGELPYKCEYCILRFAHRTTAKEHEIRAHTKIYEWFCKFCNKGFASRRDMELHELVHTGTRNCICEQCGKGFRLKHQLTEHVKIVHERLRRFKCTMCPKDFLRKCHLDDHVRVHLNIRDKICAICGKAFTSFNSLFRHKQLHAEIKRYVCRLCGQRFHQYVGLNGHMKRRHKIIKDTAVVVGVTSEKTNSTNS